MMKYYCKCGAVYDIIVPEGVPFPPAFSQKDCPVCRKADEMCKEVLGDLYTPMDEREE